MKGIVIEISEKTATVLGDDASITNVRSRGYAVGDVIPLKRMGNRDAFRRFAAIAAVFMLIFTGAYAYWLPVAYASIDINPSIEYEINVFDRVLSVQVTDENDQELFQLQSLENMNIHKAVDITTEMLMEQGYIDGTENDIVVTVGSDNTIKAQRLAGQIKDRIEKAIRKQGKKAEVNSDPVSLQRVEEAKSLQVTPGKLNLVQELIEVDEVYEAEDQPELLQQTIKQIRAQIKKNKHTQQNNGNGQ